MTWSVRHEGSPRSISGLTRDAVVEGLHAGQWETTDEVRGDNDRQWLALEHHPAFVHDAAEYEPPPPVEHPDETRLDMNPLIDVSLVLLIFFILTTTYSTIRKVLDVPGMSDTQAKEGFKRHTEQSLAPVVIRVKVRLVGGQPVIRLEDQVVTAEALPDKLAQFANATKKRQLLLDAQGVEWGMIVLIMDAARGAGIEKTLLVTHAKPQ